MDRWRTKWFVPVQRGRRGEDTSRKARGQAAERGGSGSGHVMVRKSWLDHVRIDYLYTCDLSIGRCGGRASNRTFNGKRTVPLYSGRRSYGSPMLEEIQQVVQRVRLYFRPTPHPNGTVYSTLEERNRRDYQNHHVGRVHLRRNRERHLLGGCEINHRSHCDFLC